MHLSVLNQKQAKERGRLSRAGHHKTRITSDQDNETYRVLLKENTPALIIRGKVSLLSFKS